MLTDWLVNHVRAMTPTGPYRPPTLEERAQAVAALEALLAGHPPDLTGLPLHLVHGLDAAQRPFTLLTDTPTALAPPPHQHSGARGYRTPSSVAASRLTPPSSPNITASSTRPTPSDPPSVATSTTPRNSTAPPTHTTPTNSSGAATSPIHPTPPNPPNIATSPTHPTSVNQPNPASPPNHPTPPIDNPFSHSHPPNPSTHLNSNRPGNHTVPGWGALALRETTTLLIEVPHPGSDRLTARLGLDLFHAIPTAALLIAGAHRKAADNAADVAHRPDSLFHAFAQTLATTEIQLHGFAATTAPDTDAVLSPGAGPPTALHHALAKALTQQGFRLNHHEHLAGRTNAQGIAAAARGTPFLHLELAPSLRLHHRHTLVRAIANTWHQQGQ